MFVDVVPATPLPDEILKIAKHFLTSMGFSSSRADLWDRFLVLLTILFIAFLLYLLFNKVLIRIVHYIVTHTSTHWDIILYRRKFFHRVFGLIPPLVILLLLPLAFSSGYSKILSFLEKLINIYLTVISAKILISIIESAFDYYLMKHQMATSPYKGVVEMTRLFIQTIMLLAIIGIIMNLKLTGVLTGLSAFAAVLILIFKDTLLGFIAGLQLAQNNMVKIGDWITVPNTLANGTVTDINILTVKVQNFDNTYVYVPAYTLISSPFQNWDGMVQSGVRRIKKAILIDVSTIRRPDEDELNKVFADTTVSQYISADDYAQLQKDMKTHIPNIDTNLGLFRLWTRMFLVHHPNVTNDPYLIIHDLASDGTGLPVELIFFITTTDWNNYENIQSLIFEQIMSMLSHFDLRQFQFDQWTHAPENPVKL